MKLSQQEIIGIIILAVYTAFFTHPPPQLISSSLSHPLGMVIGLAVVAILTLKVSMLVGLFAIVALVLSYNPALEYFEDKKKDSKENESKPVVPSKPDLNGTLGRLMQVAGKSVTHPPPSTAPPKPAPLAKGKQDFTSVK